MSLPTTQKRKSFQENVFKKNTHFLKNDNSKQTKINVIFFHLFSSEQPITKKEDKTFHSFLLYFSFVLGGPFS